MSQGWFQRLFSQNGAARPEPPSAPQTPSHSRPWMDVPTLMAIRSLEMRVQHLVHGLQRGIHRSVRRGSSSEFTEYRPYTPGDDLRHMDWRRLARTDRPFVRQYEDESDWGCLFIVDLSASMAFGSLAHSKADYARTLAGTLATFLHSQGDPVGLLRFAAQPGSLIPVRHAPRQMTRWWPVLAANPSGHGTGLAQALEQAVQSLKRPGLVVVVSDLLAPSDSWASPLRLLRTAHHEVVFFEVLDPQELEFPFTGDTRFEHLESASHLDLDAARARESYLQNLALHRNSVARLCANASAPLIHAHTHLPLEPILRSALQEIARLRHRRHGAPPSTGGASAWAS